MKIEIWSDFSCPFCYLGKTRLEKAVEATKLGKNIEIEYKAFQLSPNAPMKTNLNALDAFAKEKGISKEEIKQMFQYTTEQLTAEGLPVHMENMIMTNTMKAHRVAKYAREVGKETEFTSTMMKAYFDLGKDLADDQTLLELSTQIGLDSNAVHEVLKTNKYQDKVDEELHQAELFGITGVPFFVIDNKYGLSGAQPQSTFESALNQIWKESQPLETVGEEGIMCSEDSCSF